MSSGAIVTMPDGLPGFEQCRRFVVLTSDVMAPFTCLQALDEPKPSFLSLDPRRVVEGYSADLGAGDRARLDAQGGDALLWLSLVHVADDGAATINLRAPVAINSRTMVGVQVIPAESPYSTAHPLG